MKWLPSSPGGYGIVNKLSLTTDQEWPWKTYVGSSKNVRGRCRKHIRELRAGIHGNNHLQAAWNKYGENAFTRVCLFECEVQECVDNEQAWIDELRSAEREFGYNKSPTAGTCLGVHHTEEVKAERSRVIKQIWSDPKKREDRSVQAKKNWEDPEYRKVVTERSIEKLQTGECREKISKGVRKKLEDPEFQAKRTAGLLKFYEDGTNRQMLSDIQKEIWKSDERKKKQSVALKKAWEDPEFRARMSAKQRERRAREQAERLALLEVIR